MEPEVSPENLDVPLDKEGAGVLIEFLGAMLGGLSPCFLLSFSPWHLEAGLGTVVVFTVKPKAAAKSSPRKLSQAY